MSRFIEEALRAARPLLRARTLALAAVVVLTLPSAQRSERAESTRLANDDSFQSHSLRLLRGRLIVPRHLARPNAVAAVSEPLVSRADSAGARQCPTRVEPVDARHQN